MQQRKTRGLRAVPLAALLLAAQAGGLEREQFVAGWPLALPANRGVFDVPLTSEVYAEARNLDELAVLDATGRPMSFYRVDAPPPESSALAATLDASAVYATAPGRGASVDVATDADETRVRVTSDGSPSAAPTAFIVDARALEWAPAAIELDWATLERPFLLDVTIEHAEDLARWRAIGRGPVAALEIDGTETRHARVPLAGAPAGGYYRIVASRSLPDWRVLRVTLAGNSVAAAALEQATLAPEPLRPRNADEAALYFDAGGALPVERVALTFRGRNGWTRAAIASSASLDGPWRARAPSRLHYALEYEGVQFASEAATLARTEDRFWRVTFAGRVPAQPLELALGVAQTFVRFAAEGTAPYLLAAGTRAAEAGPDPAFAAVWSTLPADAPQVQRAALGARVELGGPAARAAPLPWRTISLWAALAAGVALVAALALRLARELRATRSSV